MRIVIILSLTCLICLFGLHAFYAASLNVGIWTENTRLSFCLWAGMVVFSTCLIIGAIKTEYE